MSFGAFVAGNTTGQMLAELGCDVLKIEARARPEVLRQVAYAYGRAAALRNRAGRAPDLSVRRPPDRPAASRSTATPRKGASCTAGSLPSPTSWSRTSA